LRAFITIVPIRSISVSQDRRDIPSQFIAVGELIPV